MTPIEKYQAQIERLCARYNVKTLYSFGSVNTPDFGESSDVDLMVEFDSSDPIEYTSHYFNLKFALEEMLNRSIDLLENRAIRNPFLQESIDKSKVLIYGR